MGKRAEGGPGVLPDIDDRAAGGARAVKSACAALLLLASAACGAARETAITAPSAEAPLPAAATMAKEDFVLDSLTTPGTVAVEKGKVTLLLFWATWHEPSKRAFPKLAELQQRYAARGFTVAAVSVDDEDTAGGRTCLEMNGWGTECLRYGRSNALADAARSWGANFPVGWDKGHVVANLWRPPTMTTVYLLDRKRAVVHEHRGWHDGEELEIAREIESML